MPGGPRFVIPTMKHRRLVAMLNRGPWHSGISDIDLETPSAPAIWHINRPSMLYIQFNSIQFII